MRKEAGEKHPQSINEVLAENLGFFMFQREMTQAELGSASNIAQTTVSLYLRPESRLATAGGKEPSANLAAVQRLADALEVELWELLRPLTPARRELYLASVPPRAGIINPSDYKKQMTKNGAPSVTHLGRSKAKRKSDVG